MPRQILRARVHRARRRDGREGRAPRVRVALELHGLAAVRDDYSHRARGRALAPVTGVVARLRVRRVFETATVAGASHLITSCHARVTARPFSDASIDRKSHFSPRRGPARPRDPPAAAPVARAPRPSRSLR
jgi:hypothetical protein